jgi:hypothetical protein
MSEQPDQPEQQRNDKPTLDYQPWQEQRRLPRPLKVLLWGAVIVHSIGILPALILLWFVMTDQSSRLADVLSSGACCIPFALLAILSILIVWSRIGDRG